MEKRFIIGLVTATLLVGLSCHPAWAQRTVNNSLLISADYSFPFGMKGSDFCVDLSCGQYLIDSYWNTGIIGNMYSSLLKPDDESMRYAQVAAFGEYMYRVAATRNRAVNLYLGGGAFIGYEAYDPFTKLPDYIDTGLGNGSFLYGIQAGFSTEFYFYRNVAFLIGGRIPVNFTSPVRKVNYHLSAGIRINLK